jgi:DNA (cytosine-5)-methyltransferase 1
MSAYYNENDPGAAAWLRELIKANAIAAGEVDERSIEDVRPDNLAGFKQCHFFAGIGVWSYALRLAGWTDDRPVWTGSCPCQPFSQAGRGLGTADKRHLWPVWRDLILERRPSAVFGEQVASAAAMHWLALVQDDLESGGYAFAPFDLPAASVGAPHVRQRILFVAESDQHGREGSRLHIRERESRQPLSVFGGGGEAGKLADRSGPRLEVGGQQLARAELATTERSGAAGFWDACEWIECRDGKARPIEPGTFPLAHGAPARVGRLRGYGNAIVAPLAAEFIAAYMSFA